MNISKNLRPILIVVLCTALLGLAVPVQADSLSDLQAQQAALQKQAADAQKQADAQKTLAQRAADSLQRVAGQIQNVNAGIQSTQVQIGDTQSQINQKNQDVAKLESDLRTINDQQNALVRQLYILSVSQPDELSLFSDQPTAQRQQREQEFSNLKRSVAAVYAKTQASKVAVEAARDDLQRKSTALATLKSQQQSQAQTLADAKSTQQSLRQNAEAAQSSLEAKAAQSQAQAAQVAAKIRALTATSNWGNQIVSSDDGSWYYSQTGDNTQMGYSGQTVNNVGCLITSLAMVATFYGHNITPDYIARNGSFDGYGSYYWGTPGNLGITVNPSGAVNWSIVQNEVAAGHPVIVSIYLSSVGALNSDGSSHFIVIKGYADGKYLMHDPVGGGRGYNLNQVRSMVLVRPN